MKRRESDSGGFNQSIRGINYPISAGPSRGITSNSKLLPPGDNGSHGAEAMATGNAVGKTQASSRARPRSKRFVWNDALHRAFILAVFQCSCGCLVFLRIVTIMVVACAMYVVTRVLTFSLNCIDRCIAFPTHFLPFAHNPKSRLQNVAVRQAA